MKDHYMLDPAMTSMYLSIVMLPWVFKILYGILSDTVPIFGSRKKGWMILLSLSLVVTSTLASAVRFDNPIHLVTLLSLSSVSCAGMDVIVDALMVM